MNKLFKTSLLVAAMLPVIAVAHLWQVIEK